MSAMLGVSVIFVSLFSHILANNKVENIGRSKFEPKVIDSSCQRHYQYYLEQLARPLSTKLWPKKMYDASGKYPTDGLIFGGNFQTLGSYSSCLEVDSSQEEDGDMSFLGKYCNIKLVLQTTDEAEGRGLNPIIPPGQGLLENPFTAAILGGVGISRVGVCLPDSCSMSEVAQGLVYLSATVGPPIPGYNWTMQPLTCSDEEQWDAGDYAMISVLGAFVLLCLLGTIYEVASSQRQWNRSGDLSKFMIGCSMLTNTQKLTSTANRKKDHLPCVDGIRFVSLTWVVIGHHYLFSMYGKVPMGNFWEVNLEITSPFLFRPFVNALSSVDTFFLLSGLLVAYLSFKELDRSQGRLNIPMFYLHRYLRLTGTYVLVIGFHATLYKFFNLGPATTVNQEVAHCKEVWWKNILYINNYDGHNSCLSQSWYLAVDMQLFVLSPLLMLPMWWLGKRFGHKSALAFAMVWIVIMTVVNVVLPAVYKWPMSIQLITDRSYFLHSYIVPWCRCQPYLVGLALGYVMHVTKGKEVKLRWFTVLAGWTSALSTGLAIVYGFDIHDARFGGDVPTLTESVLYNGLHRLAWASAVAWVIFACVNGYGGWINTFLSWEGFIPLGKISFNIYLVHLSLISVFYGLLGFSINPWHLLYAVWTGSTLVISCLLAFVMSLLLEMPFLNAEKLMFEMVFRCFARKGERRKL